MRRLVRLLRRLVRLLHSLVLILITIRKTLTLSFRLLIIIVQLTIHSIYMLDYQYEKDKA